MANAKDYAIQVKNVKKSFFLPNHKNDSLKTAITQVFKPKEKGGSTFNALNGVSFNVEKGDFFGVLGRNGSGKSTLLKIISEIYQPTSGSVSHKGKLVSFIELGVGFKAELSGRENVFLNGALLGFSKEEVASMYDDIVAFAELEQFMDQKLKNYSSGMKVRLAFSVAIRAKADVLILDEVLAVGDASFQKKCMNYFETLKEDGKTVILVTHSMGNVRRFCNKAVVISEGKVIFNGNADEAANRYNQLFNIDTKSDRKSVFLDKTVKIKSLELVKNRDNLEVKTTLECGDIAQDGVKFGFRINDQSGRVVAGASTANTLNPVRLDFNAGERKELHFRMDNILGNGVYDLSATVNFLDNNRTADSTERVSSFENKKDDAYYPIVYPTELRIASK